MPSVFKVVLFSLFVAAGVQASPIGKDEPEQQSENPSVESKLDIQWGMQPFLMGQLMRSHEVDPFVKNYPYKDEYTFHAEPLEESASEAAISVQPVLDYDKDSCYNVAAVDKHGKVSDGLPYRSYNTEFCREPADLDRQNVYSRTRCNNGYCAHMYEHFFEKDVALTWLPFWGHRYDWENIVVVTLQDTTNIEFVCVSQHGDYECKEARNIRFEGTHPKVVYHKDGAFTHCFRFARRPDDQVENAKGEWIRGALIDWNMWPDLNVRQAMVDKFSRKVTGQFSPIRPKLNDDDFPTFLKVAIKDRCPAFNPKKDG